jgi:ribosomal protein S27AE
MKDSARLDALANVCPKCSGTLIKDLDDDRHCLQCGYIAYARLPKNGPSKRERRPSHGGVSL